MKNLIDQDNFMFTVVIVIAALSFVFVYLFFDAMLKKLQKIRKHFSLK